MSQHPQQLEADHPRYLLRLVDALWRPDDAAAITDAACRLLGEHLDAAAVAWLQHTPQAGWEQLAAYRRDAPAAPAGGPLPALLLPLLAPLLRGDAVLIGDLATALAGPAEAALRVPGVAALAALPLQHGPAQPLHALLVTHDAARAWPAEEIEALRETLERGAAALQQAQAEAALREREASHRALFETIDEGVVIVELQRDASGRVADLLVREVNRAFERHTGRGDIAGRLVSALLPGLERRWLERIAQVADSGQPARGEDHVARLGRWFSVRLARVGGAGSDRVAAVFADITGRKLRERQQGYLLRLADALRLPSDAGTIQRTAARLLGEQLGASRAYYLTVEHDPVSGSRTHVIAADHFSRPGQASLVGRYPQTSAAEDLYGELAQGRRLVIADVARLPRLAPEYAARFAAFGVRALVVVPLLKDGRYVAALGVTADAPRDWNPGDVALVEETAERTWAALQRAQAEAALRESEQKNRAFVEATADIVYEMSADWRQMNFLAGKQFIASTERPRQDWIGPYIPADEQPRVSAAIQRAIETRSPFALEHRVFRLDGSEGWTFSRAIPLLDERGEVLKWFGTASDITARKRAEQALAESEARYRGLFESIDVGFCIIEVLFDGDGRCTDYRFVEANPAFIDQTGLAGAMGRTVRELVPQHEPFWFDVYGRIALTGEPARFEHRADALASPRWYEVFAFRVGQAHERLVGVLFRDIAERKRREANTAFLDQAGKDLARLSDPDRIMQAVGQRLALQLGLAGCVFADVDEAGGEVTVHHGWTLDGLPGLNQVFRLDEYLSPEFSRAARAGETVIVADTARDARTHAGRFAALRVGAFVSVPYRRGGRWLGYCAVTSVSPRDWRADEVELLQELSDRLFARVEQARAEEALRQNHAMFSALVENAPFGVYMVDAGFRLRSVNAGSRALFAGIEPLLGRDFAEILRLIWREPFASQAIARFRHTLASGESFVSPTITEPRANVDAVESYDWQLHRVTLPDGSHGVVCYFYDLSEQRRLQDALRAADRRKDEFLAILAHELRNPLAPIRTSLEVMKRSSDPEIERRSREVIERQTDVIVHLVDDLLDVSRIAGGRIRLRSERFTLADVIGLALEGARPLLQQRRHVVDTARLPQREVWLAGDKMRLTQAFLNLLTNAAKYTPAGGSISIDAALDGLGVTVRVHDSGLGIPHDQLDGIFELFTRLERDRGQQGLGIGLHLVRQIVELHGGSVQAASGGPGQGSTFSVQLPVIDAPPPAAQGAAADGTPALPARRVLVVDDYLPNLETMARLLHTLGHQVATARSGDEALRLLAGFRPELMLLDLNMPGLDGFEVARQARQRLDRAALRIVALTGYGQDEVIQRTLRAGFDAHLVKPVDVRQLEQVLAAAEAGGAASPQTPPR